MQQAGIRAYKSRREITPKVYRRLPRVALHELPVAAMSKTACLPLRGQRSLRRASRLTKESSETLAPNAAPSLGCVAGQVNAGLGETFSLGRQAASETIIVATC